MNGSRQEDNRAGRVTKDMVEAPDWVSYRLEGFLSRVDEVGLGYQH